MLPIGMLHAGIGPSHVNSLLKSVNLPAVFENTLKAREREIGPVFEKVAKDSCGQVVEKEKSQWLGESLNSGKTASNEQQESVHVGIGASYDAGWQKRGKGHNSLTGRPYSFTKSSHSDWAKENNVKAISRYICLQAASRIQTV